MKDTGTLYWKTPNFGASNSSGFTALPGGYRTDAGTYSSPGIFAEFWSSTPWSDITEATGRRARYDNPSFSFVVYLKVAGFSVRCIRD